MNCTHCNTPMVETRVEITNHARQSWHQCPACKCEHMLSQPYSGVIEQHKGNSHRYSVAPEPIRRTA